METVPGYSGLMHNRIRRILLVCNNYDSFSLEEDGHIETQISEEYADLNLSNPPSIVRVETGAEALALADAGEAFDLVIIMYSTGEMDVFDFSRRFKSSSPSTPVILLGAFSREMARRLDLGDMSGVDYVFCWNNSTDLLIAIIKLMEDRLNADHDILEAGVRAILLVEDSVRYYSMYLPMLYTLVLQQNIASIKDALNEEQQVLRKRSRPKVLMATCYDEAVELYGRYRSNILGVISDIGFVVHKGDRPSEEKADAGIDLCRLIREENPRMPFLLQSSQVSMRSVADGLGVGFVEKRSKTLTHDVSDFIGREFGFGDFVVTDPENGDEVYRASDLYGFEKIMRVISPGQFKLLASSNTMSKWMYARGLFEIGDVLSPMRINSDMEIEEHRAIALKLVHEYRMKQALGVVAAFHDDSYNSAIWFSRIGSGSMGGKARGLTFLYHILQKYDLYGRWEGVETIIPRTVVISMDYFDRFVLDNGLQYVINSDLSNEEILSEFVASTLPADLTASLRVLIHHIRRPLAVRSSSKLEDSYCQPFAGVYSTYMVPRVENEDQQLRLLSKAIKSVYASVYFSESRAYVTASGNMISEEKMAVIVQEVVGSVDGGYYFPSLSGVARSLNFYPVGRERPEDGVCKLAFGLGKAVVDGEQVLRFSPEYPRHVLQTSTPELAMTGTQQVMYALNLQPDKFKTSIDDGVNIERIRIPECTRFRKFMQVCSTYDMSSRRMVDSPYAEGPKAVTFSRILRYGTFPLASIVGELLRIARSEMRCDVEIEFAADLERGDGKPDRFTVLQIRPISAGFRNAEVKWEDVPEDGALLRSANALGTGWIDGVTDIVYLRRESFDILKTREMARQISEMNTRMRQQGRSYALITYGRLGTSIDSLGVPVQWADISEAKLIVECCLEDFRVDPSQGTHFFQNLTSFNVGYVNVNPYARPDTDSIDFARLDAMEAESETVYLRHLHFVSPLRVCVDGRGNRAVILPAE